MPGWLDVDHAALPIDRNDLPVAAGEADERPGGHWAFHRRFWSMVPDTLVPWITVKPGSEVKAETNSRLIFRPNLA